MCKQVLYTLYPVITIIMSCASYVFKRLANFTSSGSVHKISYRILNIKNLVFRKLVCRNSIVGDNVHIGFGSFVESSVILNNVEIGRFAYVLDSMVMNYCVLHLFDHIESSVLNRRSSCGSNTKIFNASIGKFTSISWNVSIGMPEHTYETVSTSNFVIWPTEV